MPKPTRETPKTGMEPIAGVNRILSMGEFEDDGWPGLTEREWDEIKGYFPRPVKRPWLRRKRRGGRRRASDKQAFEALLYTMRGGVFERLPRRFGSRRTAFRRLRHWWAGGTLERAWAHYARFIDKDKAGDWRRRLGRTPPRAFWQGHLAVAFRLHRPELTASGR